MPKIIIGVAITIQFIEIKSKFIITSNGAGKKDSIYQILSKNMYCVFYQVFGHKYFCIFWNIVENMFDFMIYNQVKDFF